MAYRITIHGVADRATEGKIAEALQSFVTQVEVIEGHGVYLAQFEGSKDYLRLRGEDTTLVETPDAANEEVPAIFQVKPSEVVDTTVTEGTNG